MDLPNRGKNFPYSYPELLKKNTLIRLHLPCSVFLGKRSAEDLISIQVLSDAQIMLYDKDISLFYSLNILDILGYTHIEGKLINQKT